MEKGIPFELITEVPWDSNTQTPQYNPLEKLPVLILDNGKSVYESRFILEYIEAKFHDRPPLLPRGHKQVDARLFARQVEVVADGICDALVLLFFEKQRDEAKRSEESMARQRSKVDGGLKALANWISEEREYFVENSFGLADLAAGSLLGYMNVRFPEHPWKIHTRIWRGIARDWRRGRVSKTLYLPPKRSVTRSCEEGKGEFGTHSAAGFLEAGVNFARIGGLLP